MTVIDLGGRPERHRRTGVAARFRSGRRRTRPAPDRTGRARRPPTADRLVGSGQGLAITLGILVLILCLFGSVMILSASSVSAVDLTGSSFGVFLKQMAWLALGVVAFAIGAKVDHRRWASAVPVLVIGSIVLLVAVLVPGIGVSVNGAQRWIGAGAVRVQPSEPAKLAMIVFVAALVARERHRIRDFDAVLRPVLTVLAVMVGLIMLQPNLGTAAVLCFLVGAMLLWAGVRIDWLAGLASLGVLAGLGFALSADYRRARLTGFLDPWGNQADEGYQTIQSLIGVASGGVSGTGLGESRAKWGFLPEAHTDFVYAIIAEELGLIGSLLVVGLLAAVVVCGLRIARQARDGFGEHLAVGVSAWIAVQAFVNMGAVLGLLPITGVPLPLVSFGGASLVTMMLAVGMLANIALTSPDPVADGVRARIAARRAASGRRRIAAVPAGGPASRSGRRRRRP